MYKERERAWRDITQGNSEEREREFRFPLMKTRQCHVHNMFLYIRNLGRPMRFLKVVPGWGCAASISWAALLQHAP